MFIFVVDVEADSVPSPFFLTFTELADICLPSFLFNGGRFHLFRFSSQPSADPPPSTITIPFVMTPPPYVSFLSLIRCCCYYLLTVGSH